MKTPTKTIKIPALSENYEVIENEHLTGRIFKQITISGALFTLTLFKDTTFRSCVFFASKIENCEFINCYFDNCHFQFSTIEYCDFHSTMFKNCIWDTSPVKRNLFSRCKLCEKTIHFLSDQDNRIMSCFTVMTTIENLAAA